MSKYRDEVFKRLRLYSCIDTDDIRSRCADIAEAAVKKPGERIFFHLDGSPIRYMFDNAVYYMQYYLGVTRIYRFAIPCDEVLFEIKGPPCKPTSREIGVYSSNFLFDLIYSNRVNEPFFSKEPFSTSKIYEQITMFPRLKGELGTTRDDLLGYFSPEDIFILEG